MHLIVGPTGSGKSDRADKLARKINAPVLVADRFQCLVDMPVSTARPDQNDSAQEEVRRYYLPDRHLEQGPLSGPDACLALIFMIGKLALSEQSIVVEGGSISTLGALMSTEFLPFDLKVIRRSITSRTQHHNLLRQRAREMIVTGDPLSGKGLIEEVADAWRNPSTRAVVESINGPEAVLDWCRNAGRSPDSLMRSQLSSDDLEQLIDAVADAHLFHALDQDLSFQTMFPDADVEICDSPAPQTNSRQLSHEKTPSICPRTTVTVLCGARNGRRDSYRAAAVELGKRLAERGSPVCYGGASIGLMGAIADSALEAGGDVIGVIPRYLTGFELRHRGLTRCHIVPTLPERKTIMFRYAHVIMVLPGGLGTMDELFEILTLVQLGLSNCLCLLVNIDNFFDHAYAMIQHFQDEGFVSESDLARVILTPSVSIAIKHVEQFEASIINVQDGNDD
ncbi:TIGR00730 family Rossman fold protein (plasmid) [Rhodococcoides fascians A21d2]|nr:TIGR00730 family Rossman fold protein [Rhodococcus fascians A21d2]